MASDTDDVSPTRTSDRRPPVASRGQRQHHRDPGQWHGRAPVRRLPLDLTGKTNASFAFTARDLDVSIDDAIQQIAVQYRVGASGAYTNLPAGYIADATTVSTATQTTTRNVALPVAVDNQASVFVRVMTTNAVGNDELVGIDDIAISARRRDLRPVADQPRSADQHGRHAHQSADPDRRRWHVAVHLRRYEPAERAHAQHDHRPDHRHADHGRAPRRSDLRDRQRRRRPTPSPSSGPSTPPPRRSPSLRSRAPARPRRWSAPRVTTRASSPPPTRPVASSGSTSRPRAPARPTSTSRPTPPRTASSCGQPPVRRPSGDSSDVTGTVTSSPAPTQVEVEPAGSVEVAPRATVPPRRHPGRPATSRPACWRDGVGRREVVGGYSAPPPQTPPTSMTAAPSSNGPTTTLRRDRPGQQHQAAGGQRTEVEPPGPAARAQERTTTRTAVVLDDGRRDFLHVTPRPAEQRPTAAVPGDSPPNLHASPSASVPGDHVHLGRVFTQGRLQRPT